MLSFLVVVVAIIVVIWLLVRTIKGEKRSYPRVLCNWQGRIFRVGERVRVKLPESEPYFMFAPEDSGYSDTLCIENGLRGTAVGGGGTVG